MDVVKILCRSWAPRVNETQPEFLKALDVSQLSRVACLHNIVEAAGLADWSGGSFLKKGYPDGVFQF